MKLEFIFGVGVGNKAQRKGTKMRLHVSLVWAVFLLPAVAALAIPRASEPYTVAQDSISIGGGSRNGGVYSAYDSVGGVVGVSTVSAVDMVAYHGFVGGFSDLFGEPRVYSDDFENASLNPYWNVIQQDFGAIQLSTDQAHGGQQSLCFSSTSGGNRYLYLKHNTYGLRKGAVGVWFYDSAPGQETLYSHLGVVNTVTTQGCLIGIQDWDPNNYRVFGPGVVNEGETLTYPRSLGWHHFEIEVGADWVQERIDNKVVLSTNVDFQFDLIVLDMTGPSWRPNATYYFDDFTVVGLGTLTNIFINGLSTLAEEGTNIYTCTAQYSDGATVNVSGVANWSLVGSAPAGTYMTNNLLVAGPVTANTSATIRAVYSSGGVTLTNTYSVLIHKTVVTIWSNTTAPTVGDVGPDSPVALGVKFRSDVDGMITGIRFYKADANTGAHVGNLWSSTGMLLGTATFTNETASGWQQALFATPVAIASNTVYVASYHANNGHYSVDFNYFQGKGMDNPPLRALANGMAGGNGVYAYGTSSVFPNQTYSAANYWVDVVFLAGSPSALLSVTTTSLPVGVMNVAYTEMLTAIHGILPYTWSIISGTLPSGLTLNPSSGTITGTPSATGTFSFTVQVRDAGSPAQTATKPLSISITPTSMPTVVTIWSNTIAPTVVDGGPDSPVALGVKFRSDVDGTITGIRFYKADANTGAHVGNLWTSNGALLATVTFINETASGWQQALFTTPVAIASNTVYVASYHANSGHYSVDFNYFQGKGVDNPPLHALANGMAGGNGIYAYGSSGAFPNQTWNAANYWVDVMFLAGSPSMPLSITTTSLPAGVVNVAYTETLTAIHGTSPYTWSIISGTLPSGLTLNPSSGAITGTPSATGTFSFTAQVRDAGSPTQTATQPLIISITPTVTIWSNTTAPTIVDGGPDSPVALGVKFKSDVAGTIAGIRFYKADANTGAHIGNLWTSNGMLLATVIFINETASGWQQALFTTPVAIASNTVYVASYHANSGHYSVDFNYFQGKGMDNPPLHGLMNGVFGGNGVYAYGSSSVFPNQNYNAANYWVDVVFQAGTLTTHYVSLSGAHVSPFTSWATAATNIQAAINAAVEGETVLVSNGVYATGGAFAAGLTNRVAITKALTVQSVNGPEVTIIQGQGPMGTIEAVRCAYVADGAKLVGVTLKNGFTQYSSRNSGSGGGIYCDSSEGIVSNCMLIDNSAFSWGGGVFGGTLYNCTLTGNSTVDYGGGAAGSTLYNCQLTQNSARMGLGGGAYNVTSSNCILTGNLAYHGGGAYSGTLHNCTLTGNDADVGGGADAGTLYNCMLIGNKANYGGGAGAGTFYNCTLSGNSASQGGGVLGGTFYNCVIYYNTGSFGSNYWGGTLNYSCTTPDPGGFGNITNDPHFVNAAAGDYHLQATSPCINAGTNQDWMIGATDLAGNPRLYAGGRVDMGAYEYQGMSRVSLAESSLPPPPLTSMTRMAADTSTSEMATSAAGGDVERWPWVWTSGELLGECGASNLIDGNTNTMWIGDVGGDPWRVILDLGVITDVTGIQLMFQDTAWTNKEIMGSRDSEVWFDYLAETNEWAPLRYLYINFRGDEHGAQPPAIREIIWRDDR